MHTYPPAQAVEDAVLAVLAGAPLDSTAATFLIEPTELADAISLFTNAGRAAIHTAHSEQGEWLQASIEFTTWDIAERTAIDHLLPRLRNLPADAAWWYIRKAPCWRLRVRADRTHHDAITRSLDDLTRVAEICGWRPGRYEPETAAFGGPVGVQIAHHLFHIDSAATLDYLHRHHRAIGRRELSILICAALLRAAGQEWHEQGDVWQRVARMRPLTSNAPSPKFVADVRTLMSADTTALANTKPELAAVSRWLADVSSSGHELGHAAQAGALERGIRDILAHHLIFHWNRLGLPDQTQATIARAAYDAILNGHAPHV